MKTQNTTTGAATEVAESSSLSVSVGGEMFLIKRKALNNFDESLKFVAENYQKEKTMKENIVNLRRMFVTVNGERQGKFLEL